MAENNSNKRAKLSRNGRSIEYSREEIESHLPNLADELSDSQTAPLDIPTATEFSEPRSPNEVKEVAQSHYDPESELFFAVILPP